MTSGPSSLHVDEAGLQRVLREWSGAGNLYRAAAACADSPFDRDWTKDDVERRAMRILLLECEPILARFPRSLRIWQDHLPTLSSRHRFWSDTPQARVDWAKTRQTGWPPTRFAIRRRHRSTDQVTLAVLAWTLSRLEAALDAARSLTGTHHNILASTLAPEVEQVIEQALPLQRLLDPENSGAPTRDDIRSTRAAGWPWTPVADLAAMFVAVDRGGAQALALRLLHPDGFPEVVFQLSVVGSLITACEQRGARVTSQRPIGHMTSGPIYQVHWPDGRSWDLWSEAASAWNEYGIEDVYRNLASALTLVNGTAFSSRNIRPDVLIAERGLAAVVLECKYPSVTLDPGYVGHGMYQAAFYADQLRPAFPRVLGASIGPAELVPHATFQPFGSGQLGLMSPADLGAVVDWMEGANARSS